MGQIICEIDAKWAQVAVALLSAMLTLAAIIVALFQESIRRRWFGPKFKFEFHPEPPYLDKTQDSAQGAHDAELLPSYVHNYRIRLRNVSDQPARNVEVLVIRLAKLDELRDWNDVKAMPPIPLTFSFSGKETLSAIAGHSSAFLDLGEVFQDVDDRIRKALELQFWVMRLKVAHNIHSLANWLLPGTYRITFGIYSENSVPQQSTMEIEITGNWSEEFPSGCSQEASIRCVDSGPPW